MMTVLRHALFGDNFHQTLVSILFSEKCSKVFILVLWAIQHRCVYDALYKQRAATVNPSRNSYAPRKPGDVTCISPDDYEYSTSYISPSHDAYLPRKPGDIPGMSPDDYMHRIYPRRKMHVHQGNPGMYAGCLLTTTSYALGPGTSGAIKSKSAQPQLYL